MKRIGIAMMSAILLAACGTSESEVPMSPGIAAPQEDRAGQDSPEEPPHGYIAGAAEVQEQQRSLMTVSATGQVWMVDLASEDVTSVGEVGPVNSIADDGRFVVAERTSGGLVLIDSGVWTTDHGDHVHYYQADPGLAGELDLTGKPTIFSTETRTAISAGATATLLDRERLGRGEIRQLATTLVDLAGMAAPIDAKRWAVTVGGSLRVLNMQGDIEAEAPCAEPRGGIVTRVGVVAGCAEGALLVTVVDDTPVIEAIAYPAGTETQTRATAFAARAGRPTVAAVAPGVGFWLLDTRKRVWQRVSTDQKPALVTAVDDQTGHVVGVLVDGTVVVWDSAGSEVGRADGTAERDVGALRLSVDADRAYVRGDDAGDVREIDFRDGGRVARTLVLPSADHLAEVGP